MVAHRANRDVTGKEKKTFVVCCTSLDYIRIYIHTRCYASPRRHSLIALK